MRILITSHPTIFFIEHLSSYYYKNILLVLKTQTLSWLWNLLEVRDLQKQNGRIEE